jgi:hypothetical protein
MAIAATLQQSPETLVTTSFVRLQDETHSTKYNSVRQRVPSGLRGNQLFPICDCVPPC